MDLQHIKQDFMDANIPLRIKEDVRVGAHFVNGGEGLPQITAQTLEPYAKELRDTVHIGTAGEMNFSIMAATGQQHAILVAPDKDQQRMWERVFSLIRKEKTVGGFADAMLELAQGHSTTRNFFRDFKYALPGNEIMVDDTMYEAENWLSSQARYDHIRAQVKADNIIVLPVDFMNTAQCEKLGELLEAQGITVGTLYTSNVMTYYNSGYYKGYLEGCMPISPQPGQTLPEVLKDVNHLFSENLRKMTKGNAHDPFIIEGGTISRDDEIYRYELNRKIVFTSHAAHEQFCLSIARENNSERPLFYS